MLPLQPRRKKGGLVLKIESRDWLAIGYRGSIPHLLHYLAIKIMITKE